MRIDQNTAMAAANSANAIAGRGTGAGGVTPFELLRADPLRAQPLTLIAANDPGTAASSGDLRGQALLAQDVYNDVAQPPEGYRVADAADLQVLGLSPALLGQGEFRARVYATGEGASTEYTIAFRGSQSAADWVNNAHQGLGFDSAHYRAALAIGERIARSDAAEQVRFTGHSLGGGLASAAAIASGRPADTFNAAGLHDDTIADARAIHAAAASPTEAQVDSWQVQGEILSLIQDGGDRLISPFLDLPEAYGNRHVIDAVAPEGTGFIGSFNPVSRHGIDWVLSSLPN
jgi:type VI secretion system secreted protein VgrG